MLQMSPRTLSTRPEDLDLGQQHAAGPPPFRLPAPLTVTRFCPIKGGARV